MQSTRDSTAGQRGPAAARTPDGGPVGAEGRSLGEEVVPEGQLYIIDLKWQLSSFCHPAI